MGRYLLAELVGVGGMAAVYRARDEQLGRMVALKLLAGDDAVRKRFTSEGLAAAAVDHPHIIPVYEADEADGYQYIAMRFVAGYDLQAVIRREGALPSRRVAAYVSPVASALDSAHEAGLVHRDVKPANILVDARPGRPEHVYLSDFGVVRHLWSAGGLTLPGQFVGTPDYAAPEQARGRPVDGRTDQYALACVAHELLSGSVPFRREAPVHVLYAHVYDPPPRLTEVRRDLPAPVDAVLARALEKLPERRYHSCRAFADELRAALGVEPYDPRRRAGRPSVVSPQSGLAAATRALTVQGPYVPPLPVQPPAPPPVQRRAPDPAGTWAAVVTADRAYYDNVRTLTDADTGSISFPGYAAERRFPLTGTEVRVGRRHKGVVPEIDLSGPPMDPAVSRLHAKLVKDEEGRWSVVDLASPNGVQVNGTDVPSGTPIPLQADDRIHLGAWTLITITRANAAKRLCAGGVRGAEGPDFPSGNGAVVVAQVDEGGES